MHILVTIYISYQSLLLSTTILNNIIQLQRMYNKLVPDYFTKALAYLEVDALIRALGGPLSPYLGGLGHATQKILNFMGVLVHSRAGVLTGITNTIYVCDRIWENVHSLHIRFSSFKDS